MKKTVSKSHFKTHAMHILRQVETTGDSVIVTDERGNESFGKARDPETELEIEDLRERIKVLERIATDGNSLNAQETKRISAEIEALRDRQTGSGE